MTTPPPLSGETPPPEPRGTARPWLAPAIASGLALLGLGILLIPGVLRYPADGTAAGDPAALAALEDGNRALEAEIARLNEAMTGGVCVFDGAFYPLSVEEGTGAPQADQRLDLLPPPAQSTRPAPDAVAPPAEDGAGFDGTIDDLLRRSSVLIVHVTPDGVGMGTGFFVDKGVIATNSHVVGDATEVLVASDLVAAPLPAQVVARTALNPDAPGPEEDFAILRLAAEVPEAVALTLAPPRRTQQVYAAGYPGFFVEDQVMAYLDAVAAGRSATPPQGVVTNGIVTTVQEAAGVTYMPHTAGLSPGNSGGPLVDLCGRVVGINTFVTQSTDDLVLHGDYALSSQDLAEYLTANGISPRVSDEACAPERVATPAGDGAE